LKIELDKQDCASIAQEVLEILKPLLLSRLTKNQGEDKIFDVKELAEYLKVSGPWIYEKTSRQDIPHIKVKGLLRFRKAEIDKWLGDYAISPINQCLQHMPMKNKR
jgi:excisionase family DNA binding protein